MNIHKTLQASRCRAKLDCSSKKRALEIAAGLIAADYPQLNADYVFWQLLGRERLGSTGLGQGIAIPHCRVANCTTAIGTLVTLAEAIDFESIDGAPVDLIFTLVVPEQASDEHIVMLADIAKVFNNADSLKRLRDARDDQVLFNTTINLFSAC